jgi:hypothetical protein
VGGAGEGWGLGESLAPEDGEEVGDGEAPLEGVRVIVGVLVEVMLGVRDGEMGGGVYTLGLRLLPALTEYKMVGRMLVGPEESK